MLNASINVCILYIWMIYVTEGNSFSGTVPLEIFSFPKLEDVNLGKYINQSVFMTFVSVCAKLIYFRLVCFHICIANNGLTGTLPEELGSLRSLRVVDLRKCWK